MKNLVLLFSVLVTLSSCNFYKPAMIHAPVIEEKGELNLGVSTGNGTDVAASYAITNHLAVTSSFTSNWNITSTTTTPAGEEQKFIAKNFKYDAAIGYFNSEENSFNYNFFAGYSAGQTGAIIDIQNDIIFLDELYVSAKYNSFFLQGGGFTNIGDKNYIGVIAKVSALEFSNFRYSTILSVTSNYYPSDVTQTVGQAGIQYNYKGQKFGFLGQVQYAFTDSSDKYFTLRKWGVHVGAYFRFNEMFKKNN